MKEEEEINTVPCDILLIQGKFPDKFCDVGARVSVVDFQLSLYIVLSHELIFQVKCYNEQKQWQMAKYSSLQGASSAMSMWLYSVRNTKWRELLKGNSHFELYVFGNAIIMLWKWETWKGVVHWEEVCE